MDARINRALQLLDKSKQVAASSRAKARAFAERQAKAREEAEAHLAAGLPVPSPIKHHPPPTDDAAPTRPATAAATMADLRRRRRHRRARHRPWRPEGAIGNGGKRRSKKGGGKRRKSDRKKSTGSRRMPAALRYVSPVHSPAIGKVNTGARRGVTGKAVCTWSDMDASLRIQARKEKRESKKAKKEEGVKKKKKPTAAAISQQKAKAKVRSIGKLSAKDNLTLRQVKKLRLKRAASADAAVEPSASPRKPGKATRPKSPKKSKPKPEKKAATKVAWSSTSEALLLVGGEGEGAAAAEAAAPSPRAPLQFSEDEIRKLLQRGELSSVGLSDYGFFRCRLRLPRGPGSPRGGGTPRARKGKAKAVKAARRPTSAKRRRGGKRPGSAGRARPRPAAGVASLLKVKASHRTIADIEADGDDADFQLITFTADLVHQKPPPAKRVSWSSKLVTHPPLVNSPRLQSPRVPETLESKKPGGPPGARLATWQQAAGAGGGGGGGADGADAPPPISFTLRKPSSGRSRRALAFGDFGAKLCPSAEAMAYHLIDNRRKFAGRRVLELGAGALGIAGIALAVASDAAEIVLTDGDATVVELLRHNVDRNRAKFGATKVKVHKLMWGDFNALWKRRFDRRFDWVIASDCVFNTCHHTPLLATLKRALRPRAPLNPMAIAAGGHAALVAGALSIGKRRATEQETEGESGGSGVGVGKVLLFAPRRNGSLAAFVKAARRHGGFAKVRESAEYAGGRRFVGLKCQPLRISMRVTRETVGN